MKTITNNVPRDLIDGSQLTKTEREGFDYINWKAINDGSESATFFRYKGELYDLASFMRINKDGWNGAHATSMFSAILVRYVNDGECAVVGYTYS